MNMGNIKKLLVMSLLFVGVTLTVTGCSEDDRELAFNSVLDTNTNMVFQLGDPVNMFERNLDRRGVWVNYIDTDDGRIEEREYVYDGNTPHSPTVMRVSFLNGEAVLITITPRGQERFEFVSADVHRPVEELGEHGFANLTRASWRRNYTSYGEMVSEGDYSYFTRIITHETGTRGIAIGSARGAGGE